MRLLNTSGIATPEVTVIYKTLKFHQRKDIYMVELAKFMRKYIKSKLPALFSDYFKLITNVHPHNTRQIKLGNMHH